MKNLKIRRRLASSSSPASFSPLEARQLMSVTLTPSASFETGAYGRSDLVDCSVTLKQSKSGTSFGGAVVNVILSKDKTIGNSDDVLFCTTSFLIDGKAKTETNAEEADTGVSAAAGNYYTAVQAQVFAVSGMKDGSGTVTWSKNKDVTIVTEQLPSHTVNGTSKKDKVTVRENYFSTIVTVNGHDYVANDAKGAELTFNLAGGNDSFNCIGKRGVSSRLTVNGGAGNDTISGGDNIDHLNGGSGNDKLSGGKNTDWLSGGAGKDVLDGGVGFDNLSGGSGKDKAKKDASDAVSSVETLY